MPNSSARLFYTLMTWLGGAVLALSLILLVINQSDLIDGEEAEGTTYEYVKFDDEPGNARYPRVKFRAGDGHDYYFVDSSESAMNRQQRRFDVLYDPADPTRAMVYNKMDVFGTPLILGITGLGSLAFGLVARRAANKNQWEEND